jgi:ATP-dependent exoDNAse (exonuclease V) alpha subunit
LVNLARSSVATEAYRSGEKLVDARTGETYDYERRTGVIHTEIFLPCGKIDREELWNLAEMTEKRRDAKVAREIVVALPHELNQEQQIQLVQDYAQSLSYRTGWGIDVAVHAPGRDGITGTPMRICFAPPGGWTGRRW